MVGQPMTAPDRLGVSEEEILKRLAAIEGRKLEHRGFYRQLYHDGHPEGEMDPVYKYYESGREWNPLTNPADTYALIEKHRIGVEPCDGGVWEAYWGRLGDAVQHESLAMAVCLAVLEANK